MKAKPLLFAVALPLSAIATGSGCDDKSKAPAAAPPAHVTVTTVDQRDVPIQVRAVGTLRANQIANISAQIAGNLVDLKFEDGDKVKVGNPIALLDSDVQKSSYEAALASMETAKFTYENTKEMLAAEASTPFEVTQNLNAYNESKSIVAQQKAVLDKLTLQAPFDGRLGIHMRDVGDYLDQGDDIVSIVDDDPMLIDFRVPELFADRLAVGQQVTLTPTASSGGAVTGKVAAVDPQIDLDTRTVLVRAEAPNPDSRLISGRFVHVEQTIGTIRDALLIPQQAIVPDTRNTGVFVVKDDMTVERRTVELGEYLGTDVVVTDGLKAGERVVLRGWQSVHSGAKVIIDDSDPTMSKSGTGDTKTQGHADTAKDEGAAQ